MPAPTAVRAIHSNGPEPSLDEVVELEVLDMVARGLPEGFGSGVVPLAVAAVLLQTIAAPPHLVAWVVVVAVVLALGVAVGLYFRRHPASHDNVAGRSLGMYVLVGSSGLSWGIAGWLFVPAPWQAEMFVLTLLTSLAAAVLANIGASLPHYLVFVTGLILPTAVYRPVLGGAMNLGLCIGAVMMMVVLAVFAARLAAATRRSLRIGHENRRLAQALEQRTREAERANLDKSRFIAAASHDLRQPVHALGLLLDVLQGQSLGPQALGTAARMAHVLDSLESLFTGLLDISRLDSGAIVPRRTDFALQPLLDTLTDELDAEIRAKGLSLRCHRTDARVHSDPLLLERILRNLLVNAVRYTPSGGVLAGCRRRGATLRIEIWDSGIGIDEGQQTVIFDEFYQVANRERDAERGLGLGLAIVRRLARLLDHPVGLRSRPGRGSVFRIDVPLASAAAPSPDTLPATRPRDTVPAGRQERHVLVVDDDVRARDALAAWLASWGCRVTACGDAQAVQPALAGMATAPDALVTDWRLPGDGDGLDVIRLVRARYGPTLPAILITGDALDDARRIADAHGVLLLHKPVRPAALRAALEAHWLAPDATPATVSSTGAEGPQPQQGDNAA